MHQVCKCWKVSESRGSPVKISHLLIVKMEIPIMSHRSIKWDIRWRRTRMQVGAVLPAGSECFSLNRHAGRKIARKTFCGRMFERLTHCTHLSTHVTGTVSTQYFWAWNRIYRTKCKTTSVKLAHISKSKNSRFKTVKGRAAETEKTGSNLTESKCVLFWTVSHFMFFIYIINMHLVSR